MVYSLAPAARLQGAHILKFHSQTRKLYVCLMSPHRPVALHALRPGCARLQCSCYRRCETRRILNAHLPHRTLPSQAFADSDSVGHSWSIEGHAVTFREDMLDLLVEVHEACMRRQP